MSLNIEVNSPNKVIRKETLGICITTPRLIQSFLTTDIIDKLSDSFELKIFVENSQSNIEALGKAGTHIPEEIIFLSRNSFQRKIEMLYLDFVTCFLARTAKSFETRIRWRFNLPAGNKLTFQKIYGFKGARRLILGLSQLPFINLLIGWVLKSFLSLSIYFRTRNLTEIQDVDKLMILTGGAFGGFENVMLKLSRSLNVTSFLVVDNWDNLSSKSVFPWEPHHVGVWGTEMEKDARLIQQFSRATITRLGCSRVNILAELEPIEVSFVYFVGSGKQWIDEWAQVKILAKLLAEYKPDWKIVYRPHPFFTEKKEESVISFRQGIPNLELDNFSDSDSFYGLEALQHIEQMIKGSEFVIGSHSTMLVEALHYGKFVVALSWTESKIFLDGDAWAGYDHMLQIRGNPGVFEARSPDQVQAQFSLALSARSKGNLSGKNLVPEILPSFNEPYGVRLEKFLKPEFNPAITELR